MNVFIRKCLEAYGLSLGGIALALALKVWFRVSDYIIIPYIFYDLAALAYTIGTYKVAFDTVKNVGDELNVEINT